MNDQSDINPVQPEESAIKEQVKALQLADEAGRLLLENGAEISRVEGTMERLASAYEVNDESFFVLSNGIIPLVPGGGIFWTAYYVISNHLRLAATTGFTALKVTIAIAGGIIIAGAIAGRLQKRVIAKHRHSL